MAGIKIVDLPPLGRDLASTDLLELSLAGGTGSRKITGQEIMNASKLSINNTPIINGTVGRVLFQGTGDVLQQSSSLFWDNTNARLGVGTSSPAVELDIVGAGKFSTNLNVGSTTFTSTATPNFISLGATYGDGTNFGTKVKLLDSGSTQWGIGVSSSTGINYFGANHYFYGSSSNESIKLFPSTSNTSTTTPSYLDLGSSYSSVAGANPKIRLFGTSYAIGMSAGAVEYFAPKHVFYTGNVLINTTTDAGFRLDVNGTARVKGTSLTDYGFTVANSANNLMFFGAGASNGGLPTISSATGRLMIYPTEGTLNRYVDFSNTSVRFNQLILEGEGGQNNINLSVGGSGALRLTTTISTNPIEFFTNNNNRASITASTGNFLIGTTTDAGFRLDVNGTARITGTGTATSNSFVVQNSASVQTFRVNDLGQVQIGRTTAINWTFSSNTLSCSQYAFILSTNGSALSTSGNGGVLGNDTGAKICDQGLGSSNQLASAVLECNSTTRGFLPPRMTQAERNAIASPAIGLEIYQTDATEGKYIYKSSGWTYIG